MKRSIIIIAALCLSIGAMAQDIKVKKGKVTMTEAQYKELSEKAAKAELLTEQIKTMKLQLEASEASNKRLIPLTFQDSASYAIGQDIVIDWKNRSVPVNTLMVSQAIEDLEDGTFSLTPAQTRPLLERFQDFFMRSTLEPTIMAGKQFLAQNANNKSVRTTQSGLQYQRIKAGKGKRPQKGSKVKVHYTGTLIDGTKFDSSYDRNSPLELTVGVGQVIPGWDEGLLLMEEGSTYKLFIPYNLAYGERAIGDIPAGSTLIFEMTIVEVK